MAAYGAQQLQVSPQQLEYGRVNKVLKKDDGGDNSPLVFEMPRSDTTVVRRLDQEELQRRETHLEEPRRKRRTSTARCHVPNGLSSEIFRPLWTAVFYPKKLLKRIIISADLERLCVALLGAAKAEERPFLTVGCYIKGLCIILSQKLQFLSEDVTAMAKKLLLVTTPAAITGRPKQRKMYREDTDDEYELPKRRRGTNKQRKFKKQVLAIEDYYDAAGSTYRGVYGNENKANDGEPRRPSDLFDSEMDYMPMDQIEVLQLMNFGIGLGVGTELAFYSAGKDAMERGISYHNFEHGMVERPVLSLDALNQNRETIHPDTFLDVNSLSSPFKLNGYCFTPQTRLSTDLSEADTTIASTEMTVQSDSVELNSPEFKRYDIDWDIYNDPFEEDMLSSNSKRDSKTGEIVPVKKRVTRIVLESTDADGKLVHLVKSRGVGRYDAKITSKTTKTPRRMKPGKSQTTLDTFVVSPQIKCDKMELFTNAIDSLVRSVIGHMPSDEPSKVLAIEGKNKESAEESNAGNKHDKDPKRENNHNKGDRWIKNLEKQTENSKKLQHPRQAFDRETMNTVEVIEKYRACIREKGETEPIQFAEIAHGRSRENTALIFYRTLVIANAGFISLSQEPVAGSPIEVRPSRRFWEPIRTSRDIRA